MLVKMSPERAELVSKVVSSYVDSRVADGLSIDQTYLYDIVSSLSEYDPALSQKYCGRLSDNGFIAGNYWFYPHSYNYWSATKVRLRTIYSMMDTAEVRHCTGVETVWVRSSLGTFEATILEAC